jgi:hypothetical protein
MVSSIIMLVTVAVILTSLPQAPVSGQTYTTTETLYTSSFTLSGYVPPSNSPIPMPFPTGYCFSQAFPVSANGGDTIMGTLSSTDQIYVGIMSSSEYPSFLTATVNGCGSLIGSYSKYYRYGYSQFQWTAPSQDNYEVVLVNGQPHDVSVTVSIQLITTAYSQSTSFTYNTPTYTSPFSQTYYPYTTPYTTPYQTTTEPTYTTPLTSPQTPLNLYLVAGIIAGIAIAGVVSFVFLRFRGQSITAGQQTKLSQFAKPEPSSAKMSGKQFCISCGNSLKVSSKFCNECGAKQS